MYNKTCPNCGGIYENRMTYSRHDKMEMASLNGLTKCAHAQQNVSSLFFQFMLYKFTYLEQRVWKHYGFFSKVYEKKLSLGGFLPSSSTTCNFIWILNPNCYLNKEFFYLSYFLV